MRILIVNVHSACNLGDVGIMHATLAKLRAAAPAAHITVAANDPASWAACGADAVVPAVATWLGDPLLGKWRTILWRGPLWGLWMGLAALLFRLAGWRWCVGDTAQRATQSAYYGADVVLSCGGGNFYAARPVSPALWAAMAAAAWALALGKPVVMLPQSIGPLVGRVQQVAMRLLLARVRRVWVREPNSLAVVQTLLGTAARVDLLPDLALGLPPVAPRPLPPGPKLGICVMDRGAQRAGFAGQAAYERALVELGTALYRSHEVQVYLVAQVFGPSPDQDDRRVAARVHAQFAAAGIAAEVVDDSSSPVHLQALYGALDLVVATRMHAAIFALTCGTPVIALGYQPKSCGLMAMIGLGEYCLPIEQAATGELAARATRILDNPAPIRGQIARALHTVRARLDSWSVEDDLRP